MRKPLLAAVAMLLVAVGCPSEFGIEGRLDKAMEQDTEEMLRDLKQCPAGKHWEEPKEQEPCTSPSCVPRCVPDEMVEELKPCPAGMHWNGPEEPCTNPPCAPACVADEADH